MRSPKVTGLEAPRPTSGVFQTILVIGPTGWQPRFGCRTERGSTELSPIRGRQICDTPSNHTDGQQSDTASDICTHHDSDSDLGEPEDTFIARHLACSDSRSTVDCERLLRQTLFRLGKADRAGVEGHSSHPPK